MGGNETCYGAVVSVRTMKRRSFCFVGVLAAALIVACGDRSQESTTGAVSGLVSAATTQHANLASASAVQSSAPDVAADLTIVPMKIAGLSHDVELKADGTVWISNQYAKEQFGIFEHNSVRVFRRGLGGQPLKLWVLKDGTVTAALGAPEPSPSNFAKFDEHDALVTLDRKRFSIDDNGKLDVTGDAGQRADGTPIKPASTMITGFQPEARRAAILMAFVGFVATAGIMVNECWKTEPRVVTACVCGGFPLCQEGRWQCPRPPCK